MQEKRERGLCFRCDERFSPGHHYKQKTLQVLWVTDDEEEDEIDPPLPNEATGGVELADGPITAVLCISSMVRFCPPHLMKVRGKIKSREVIVLIDSGASHNFISEHIVSELQLRCDPTQKFGVQMGNGDEVKTSRVCRGLCLQLAEIDVIADFFPLKLGTSDVVLGFQWLATLGDSVMNWGNLCLQVTLGGVKVKIQGDPALSKSQVSLNILVRTLKREGQGILVELQTMTTESETPATTSLTYPLSSSITQLLAEYQNIFEVPMGLPPPRSKEHSIILQPGTSPISVRPYRYPQLQKNEIERLVAEML